MANEAIAIPYFWERNIERSREGCAIRSCDNQKTKSWLCYSSHPGGVRKKAQPIRLCQEHATQLRDSYARAGANFWGLEHIIADATRRLLMYDDVLRLSRFGEDVWFTYDPYLLLRDARMSFVLGQFVGAITAISAAVELALREDSRCAWTPKSEKELGPSLGLMIKRAGAYGCPVSLLLDSDEQVGAAVRFVKLRNYVAHGRGLGLFGHSILQVGPAEKETFNQLRKGQRFLVDWGTSIGNPYLKHQSVEQERREEWQKSKEATFRGTIMRVAGGAALNIEYHNAYDDSGWQR